MTSFVLIATVNSKPSPGPGGVTRAISLVTASSVIGWLYTLAICGLRFERKMVHKLPEKMLDVRVVRF